VLFPGHKRANGFFFLLSNRIKFNNFSEMGIAWMNLVNQQDILTGDFSQM